MKINKITISNILGIKELQFEPGNYVEVTGKNGTGKTSVVEAIKAALKGGNDVTLIRNGAEKGEIAIEFNNGMVLNKFIANKSDLKLFDENGSPIKKPQSQLDLLYDLISVNPVEFLTIDKKSRTRVLLENLPIVLTTDEIKEIIKGYTAELKFNTGGHALEVMDSIHKIVYEERTGINRSIKEKGFAISQLKESLVEIDYNPDEVETKINELERKQEERYQSKEKYIAKINDDLRIRIAELEKLKIEAMEKARTDNEQLIEKFNEHYAPAQEELVKLREQMKHIGGAIKTKELISQYNSELLGMEGQTDDLTTSLTNIETIKLSKMENLPIQGLSIKDGEIYKDDVIFDRLNTAEQIKVAVEVAKLRSGEIGLVCVDGLERFDETTYEMFKKAMKESGLQAIVTRVSNDEELNIN